MNEFGNYLKELRGNKSLREVAKEIGISHSYLNSLEKGMDPRSKRTIKPTFEVLNKLASFYNVQNGALALKAGYGRFEYEKGFKIEEQTIKENRHTPILREQDISIIKEALEHYIDCDLDDRTREEATEALKQVGLIKS